VFYRYEMLKGDPLDLSPISDQLKKEGVLRADGFAQDTIWTNRTAAHIYPDTLANLYTSLQTSRVCNPADILVSLIDGYYVGWAAFEYIVKLAATHGNAMRASSTAFVMSTHRHFGDYVTADQANGVLKG
jgi:tRNA isopentenyl-2-thiomethyl-A-37 hydroxylase MiaE